MLCMHVRARLFISATETQAVVAYKKFIQSQSSCCYCKILTELAMYWQLPCGKIFFCHMLPLPMVQFNSKFPAIFQILLLLLSFCVFFLTFTSVSSLVFFFGLFAFSSHSFLPSSQRASKSQPTSSHLRRCFT